MWNRKFDRCISCKTTTSAYMARGLCKRCYLAAYRAEHGDKIAGQKRAWYERNFEERLQAAQKMKREELHFGGNREAVLERDGRRCTRCASTEDLIVHHEDGNGRRSPTPNNDMGNLITLCRGCHAIVHQTLDRWSKNFDQCRRCGTTETPHNAKGFCRNCYRFGVKETE